MDNRQVTFPKVSFPNVPMRRILWWMSMFTPLAVLWVFGYWGHVCPLWMDLYVCFTGMLLFIAAAAYTGFSLFKHFDT